VSRLEVAVTEAREQFGNPEEGEWSTLEAVTRGLVKTVAEDTSVCACAYVCACETMICKE
jgi:hypothetical protein